MTEPTQTPHPHLALTALRDDAKRLTPAAARMASRYLPAFALPDTWMSALLHNLRERVGTTPPPLDLATLTEIGWPGHWGRAAYVGDASDARLWLAAVEALTATHAPSPPPAA